MTKKVIVTHINPDLDAITAVWLWRRFGAIDLARARVRFVPAGEKLNGEKFIHVDTGLGRYDHHQESRRDEDTCAALLVYEELKKKKRELRTDEALARLLRIVNEIDHFRECFWPEPTDDRYLFMADSWLDGLKLAGKVDDRGLVDLGCKCLDGIYQAMKLRVKAEKEIATKGRVFKTRWGKALAVLSSNAKLMHLAQKMGYRLVVKKDPENETVRIKAVPDSEIDLSQVYRTLTEKDPEATWFLHSSRKMVLNGSSKNPQMRPSRLNLDQLVAILERQMNN